MVLTALLATAVLFKYLQHHDIGRALLYLALLGKEMLADVRPNAHLGRVLAASFLSIPFFISLLIIGRALLEKAVPSFPDELAPGAGLAAGLGLLSSLMALLNFMHLIYPATAGGIYVLCVLAGGILLATRHEVPGGLIPGSLSARHRTVLVSIMILLWLGALFPETTYDALVYHLAYPSLYKMNHGYVPTPESFYASFPQTVEMLYLFGLTLWDETFAKLFPVALSAALILFFLGAAVRAGGGDTTRWAGVLGAVAFFSAPMAVMNVWTCMVDLGPALFAFGGLLLMTESAGRRRTQQEGAGGLAFFAGLFCGWAMGAKYTAFPLILLIPAACGFLRPGKKLLLIFASAAILAVSPWILRNIWVNHNPVYPFLGVTWGVPPIDPQYWGRIMTHADVHHPAAWLAHPGMLIEMILRPVEWLSLNRASSMGDDAGATGLFCLGSLLFLPFLKNPAGTSEESSVLGSLQRFVIFGGVLWVLSGGVPRYLLMYLAPLFLFWTLRLLPLPLAAGVALRTSFLLMLVVGCLNGAANLVAFEGRKVLWGAVDRETFLSSQHPLYPAPPYAAYRYLNHSAPPDARVLVVGEARGYYLERPFVISSVYDPSPLVVLARQSRTGEELYQVIRKKGIRYIVLNALEAQRTRESNTLGWDAGEFEVLKAFWSSHIEMVFSRVSASDGVEVFVYKIVEKSGRPADIPAVLQWSRMSAYDRS